MANPQQVGINIPTTSIWDVSEIYSTNLSNPEEMRELFVRLYQNLNRMALIVNAKESSYYPLQQLVNGQLWFPNPSLSSASTTNPTYRQDNREVFNIGSISAGTTTIAHGIPINASYTFTRIYGIASDTVGNNYVPIPYASNTANSSIELKVNATNIVITVGSAITTTYNYCYVVLEFLTS